MYSIESIHLLPYVLHTHLLAFLLCNGDFWWSSEKCFMFEYFEHSYVLMTFLSEDDLEPRYLSKV